jgi:hypothetical protein
MKIIYDQEPLPYIVNNHPERIGKYNYHKSLEIRKDPSRCGHSDSTNLDQNDNPERPVNKCIALDGETWEWLLEYDDILVLAEIRRLVRIDQLIRGEFA